MGACVQKQRFAVIKAHHDHVTVLSDAPAEEAKTSSTSYQSEVQVFLAGVNPALILLDLHLPINIGANLLKIIGEASPGVPVVSEVQSGLGHSSFLSIEAADKGFVLKPLESVQLVDFVKKAALLLHGRDGDSNKLCYSVLDIAASLKQARRYGKNGAEREYDRST